MAEQQKEIPGGRPGHLPATLRQKHRYIAYKIISEQEIPFPDIMNAIWHDLLNFLGEFGTSNARVRLVRDSWDEKKRIGLIRCSHTAVEQVRAALALVSRIGDTPVIISVLGVSGTIKSARKKFFGETDLASYV